MYTSRNDKQWSVNSCEQQNIRMNPYGKAKILYTRDVIYMISHKRFQYILSKIFMLRTCLTSPNCRFVQLIYCLILFY